MGRVSAILIGFPARAWSMAFWRYGFVSFGAPVSSMVSRELSGWPVRGDCCLGWSTNYNVGVQDVSGGGAGTKYVYLPSGLRIQLTAASVPTSTSPNVSCTVQAGYPILANWMYNTTSSTTYFVITFADRTKWVTTSLNGATNCYLLSQIQDRNYTSSNPTLNCITFNYTTGLDSAGDPLIEPSGYGSAVSYWPLLTSITDGSGSPLLVINRAPNSSGNITSIEDRYGRFIFYHEGMHVNAGNPPVDAQQLDYVSQVVQGVPTSTPPTLKARLSSGWIRRPMS